MGLTGKIKKYLRPLFAKNKIYLYKLLLPAKNFKTEDSIIISSETRGGSTWLMELINAVPDLIINWEPLHEIKGVVPEKLKWGQRPFISESSVNVNAKQLLSEILTFKRLSKNSVRYCS